MHAHTHARTYTLTNTHASPQTTTGTFLLETTFYVKLVITKQLKKSSHVMGTHAAPRNPLAPLLQELYNSSMLLLEITRIRSFVASAANSPYLGYDVRVDSTVCD